MKKSARTILIVFLINLILNSLCNAQTKEINFSSKGISLNGNLLTLPSTQNEITEIFGSPTNIGDAPNKDSATVIEWANLGIYAYKRADSDTIYAIGISINPKFPERKFETSFSGNILINQKNLALTKKTIKSLGFRRTSKYANWRQNLGLYYLTIITETPDDAREMEFGISSK